jgi:hypothetical protein
MSNPDDFSITIPTLYDDCLANGVDSIFAIAKLYLHNSKRL